MDRPPSQDVKERKLQLRRQCLTFYSLTPQFKSWNTRAVSPAEVLSYSVPSLTCKIERIKSQFHKAIEDEIQKHNKVPGA